MAKKIYGERFYQARLICLGLMDAVGTERVRKSPDTGVRLIMAVGYTYEEAESILMVFLSSQESAGVVM